MLNFNPIDKKETRAFVFKSIIWPRKKNLGVGLVLIIISELAGLILPGAAKYLADNIIPAKDIELLMWLVLVLALAVTIQAISSFVLTQVLSVEAENLITQLRAKVQRHIIYLPIRYFDNIKTGELVSRIMSDVEGVKNLVGSGLVQIVGGFITSFFCFIFLVIISPVLTVCAVVPVFIFCLVHFKTFSKIRQIFQERWEINGQVTGRLIEGLGGVRVIKGFNAEDQEIKSFYGGVQRLFLNVKKSLISESFVNSSAILFAGLASAGIMGFGGRLIIEGQITIGDFLAFTLYLGFMIEPIFQISGVGSQLTEAFAGLDRIGQVFSTTLEESENNRIIKVENIHGEVVFDCVSFAYEEDKEVLKKLSFKASAGSITALIGSSGSGKSTIAGLVASFLNPESGTITVDGNNLGQMNLECYRSQLGLVLQDDFLFEGTIKENILFSSPNASNKELMHAIFSAHILEFTDRFEEGLDTLIGERGVKLSGGQRQRISIARAILANPRILILDEATSNLDTESEALIKDSLKELMKGRTTFVIAHRLSTIRQSDQILVIEKGCIVERGKHDELMKIHGRYYQLYTYQERI